MRPELRAIAAEQGGLITRRQAVEAGYSERELRTLTATHGPWVVVRRGVYVERELWEALDEHEGRMALSDRAAHLSMAKPHAMSHDSAARLLGLEILRPRLDLSHIVRRGVGGSRTEHGVKHHLARVSPGVVDDVDGIRVTGLARTALDVAREHGYRTGLTAVDAVMRRGVTRADLEAELELMTNWPHVTESRRAVEDADAGAETVGESLARELVAEAGLGRAETQFPVRLADGRVVWCDLRVGCHTIEFDGRVKYTRAEDGGVADRPVEDIVWDEKERQRLVCAEGLGMSRLVWQDYFGAQRAKAIARLRAESDVTRRRFGDVLPEHLERFAREMRGRRRAT